MFVIFSLVLCTFVKQKQIFLCENLVTDGGVGYFWWWGYLVEGTEHVSRKTVVVVDEGTEAISERKYKPWLLCIGNFKVRAWEVACTIVKRNLRASLSRKVARLNVQFCSSFPVNTRVFSPGWGEVIYVERIANRFDCISLKQHLFYVFLNQ